MHNAAFGALGINAQYELFEVKPQDLVEFINSIGERGILGFNVTIPHKENILKYVQVDKTGLGVEEIGAVNTVKVEAGGRLKGFNTDWAGFGRHLEELNIRLDGKNAAVIGVGGAARAICFLLLNKNVRLVSIYDIDNQKAERLAADYNKKFGDKIKVADSIYGLEIGNKDILINASPQGMGETDSALFDPKCLNKNIFVYDLIYNPPKTKLLEAAQKIGARHSNGLGMLVYQGAISFEIWTGQKAPVDVMKKAVMR